MTYTKIDDFRHNKTLLKILLYIIIILLIAATVWYIIKFGISLGKGNGKGENAANGLSIIATSTKSTEPSRDIQIEKTEDKNALDESGNVTELIIIVKKSTYYLNDKEVTLDSIKDYIETIRVEQMNVVLQDDYGSAKAWDNIKRLMNDLGIVYTESVK